MSEIDRVFLLYVLPGVVGWALGVAMSGYQMPFRWQERIWIVGRWFRKRRARQDWADLQDLERDEWEALVARQGSERRHAAELDLTDDARAALADVHEIEQAHMRDYFESYRRMVAIPAAREAGILVSADGGTP